MRRWCDMTLVFGFKWLFDDGDSVLMVSDTRATTPFGIMFEAVRLSSTGAGELLFKER
jgi:hypothetical protein